MQIIEFPAQHVDITQYYKAKLSLMHMFNQSDQTAIFNIHF